MIDDDESQQRVGRPDHRRHVDDQRHHRAGGADAGGADAEGERVELLDVEPDHQRAGVIVGAGADRRADQREAEEREQERGEQDRGGAGIELGGVDDQRAELEAVVGIGGLHGAGVRTEDDQEHVDDDDRQRHQQQELAVLRPGDEGIDQSRLQRVAEHEQHRGDRHHHDQRIEVKCGKQHDREIHRDRHHLAMGEIDDAHHAENDREPERHQAIDQAGQNSADGNVQIDVERHRAGSAAVLIRLHRPFRLGVGGLLAAPPSRACRRGSGSRRP